MQRSRIVAWLRILLPLAALALLSGVFLLGRSPQPGGHIPFADVDPQELAERQVITQPTYATVTSDGAELSVAAREAVPGDSEGQGAATALRMSLRDRSGRVINVVADQGLVGDDGIKLTQNVRLTTNDGWVVTAQELLGQPGQGRLQSDQPVQVQAPFGELSANAMILRPRGQGQGDHVLDLNGAVRLIYRP